MGGIISIIRETGDMSSTAPPDVSGNRYTGPAVKKDGKNAGELVCPICGKPYDECTCQNDTLRSPDNPIDNPLLTRMGNVPQKEATMDPLDALNNLLLEEYLGNPSTGTASEVAPASDGITSGHRSFSEQFYDYMKKHGDDIDRKPSDGPLKPSNNGMKVFYGDHFNTKTIR